MALWFHKGNATDIDKGRLQSFNPYSFVVSVW